MSDSRFVGNVVNLDEKLLASLGYKQELKRQFTSLEVRIRSF